MGDVFTACFSTFQKIELGDNFETQAIIDLAMEYTGKVPPESLLKFGKSLDGTSFIEDSPFV